MAQIQPVKPQSVPQPSYNAVKIDINNPQVKVPQADCPKCTAPIYEYPEKPIYEAPKEQK